MDRRRMLRWCGTVAVGLVVGWVALRLPVARGVTDLGRRALWRALIGGGPETRQVSWRHTVPAAVATGQTSPRTASCSFSLTVGARGRPALSVVTVSLLGCPAGLEYRRAVAGGWEYRVHLGLPPPPYPRPGTYQTVLVTIPRPPRGRLVEYRFRLTVACQPDSTGRRLVSGRLTGACGTGLTVATLPPGSRDADLFVTCPPRFGPGLPRYPFSFSALSFDGHPADLSGLTCQSWNDGRYRVCGSGDRVLFWAERSSVRRAAGHSAGQGG